jgi:acetylornithine deacetylase/succinyl-diaminopimelate desuccinylase-like protein
MRMFACLLLLASAAAAQTRYPVDWRKLEPEILERFTTLLRIDTSNPPGNESKAATAIKAILDREGIPSKIFSLTPSRGNLVARVIGSGAKRPLLLLGHTDVVGVQRDKWKVDPFAAFFKDGVFHARGANDDKDSVVASLTVLSLLHRMKVKLDRDVIFLAEAGEEGTPSVGIDFMVKRHWPEIEAEFALAEGGGVVEVNGKVSHLLVATTEKVPRHLRLIARGPAGHGSRPVTGNAVVRLANAVSRVAKWELPLRLNQTTRAYFDRMASVSAPADAARFRAILNASADADRYFRAYDSSHYAILRTTISPTIIQGGFQTNVIPSEAQATLDVRLLPDEDFTKFLAELRRVIDDPAVEVTVPPQDTRPVAPPSRLDSELFRAIETVGRRLYSAPTIPAMMTGATDNAQLRAKGVQAYGIGQILVASEGPVGSAHSDDETISVRSLMGLCEFLWNTTIEVAAAR